MTAETHQLIHIIYVHLAAVEAHIKTRSTDKAEFRARELAENAKLLANALFREQRTSGEVK